MGQRVIKFSDLSGENIEDEEEIVRIVVTQHPDLEDGPVEIEALSDEVEDIDENRLDLVTFELHFPDQDEPETVVMEVEAFNNLTTNGSMSDILKGAKRVRRGAVSQPPAPAATRRLNYASLEHAGKPHKGRTQDAEKQLVREHLDKINERLKADGLRTIDLDNEDHVSRYGLEELAKERKQ